MDLSSAPLTRRPILGALAFASAYFLGFRRAGAAQPPNAVWRLDASAYAPNVSSVFATLKRAAAGTATFDPKQLFSLLPLNPESSEGVALVSQRSSVVFDAGNATDSGPAGDAVFIDATAGKITITLPGMLSATYTSSEDSFAVSFNGKLPAVTLWGLPKPMNMPLHYTVEKVEFTPHIFSTTLYNAETSKRLRLDAIYSSQLSRALSMREGNAVFYPADHSYESSIYLDQPSALLLVDGSTTCCESICKDADGTWHPDNPDQEWWIVEVSSSTQKPVCSIMTTTQYGQATSHASAFTIYSKNYGPYSSQQKASDYLSKTLHGNCHR